MSRNTRCTLIALLLLAQTLAAGAADRFWAATKPGVWSDAANWKGGVPGPADTAIFDGRAPSDATIDKSYAGQVGTVKVLPGYKGTITQERDLKVKADLRILGGTWSFTPDQRGALYVAGNTSVAKGASIICTRSSTAGEGRGRTITVGGSLTVLGSISADAQGFAEGPGTPTIPTWHTDSGMLLSPAGAGHGGRGAGVYRDPKGRFTGHPHWSWTDPPGSGRWQFPAGGAYGSITEPTSLGSGAKVLGNPGEVWSEKASLYTCKGAFGGGAIRLAVKGKTVLHGKISADGGLAGETGASGGSVYIKTFALVGSGVVSANGSDAPGLGQGRGGGGGGRVSVVLTGAKSTFVRLQAFGGAGKWSPKAAAGTVYVKTPGKSAGALIVANNGGSSRSMNDICTSLRDLGPSSYKFESVQVSGGAVLYIGRDDTLATRTLSGSRGNVVSAGKFGYARSSQVSAKESANPVDERTRELLPASEVIALGDAPTLREELLARSCQISFYPTSGKLLVAADLSTYPYPDEVRGVSAATAKVISRRTGEEIARAQLEFDQRKYAETTITLPNLKDGVYETRITLHGGTRAAAIPLERARTVWENNRLGVSDKIYPPFEPLSVTMHEVMLSSGRRYEMNGFGMFNRVVSLGRDILADNIALRCETAEGMKSWEVTGGYFTTAEPHLAVYESRADAGALRVESKTSVEYDGCAKVEMQIKPGSLPEEVRRMWIEIPYLESETPLFHYTVFNNIRRNYAGRTPSGGKIVWETGQPEFIDKRPPTWSVQPGTESRDGVIWTSENIRPDKVFSVNPFIPYIWLGGPERGLAWFAESDKGWLPDTQKPAQVLTREKGKLVLRIYIINKPTTITAPRSLVFGLQASPTRPMMPDFRAVDRFASWGRMSVIGAMFCCDKFPFGGDMSLVDSFISAKKRETSASPADLTFLDDKARELEAQGWPENAAPYAWLAKWKACPTWTTNYFEEHWTNPNHHDFDQFSDEWMAREYSGAWPRRETSRVVYDSPHQLATGQTGQAIGNTFCPSLVDFSVYYANELLKRGVSLYFDNTWPHTSFSPTMSDAHLTETGQIQPAVTIWAQREYYKRIWALINEYNERGMTPPVWFTQHMTNTLVLPLNTWTTANLDLEWSISDPATGKKSIVMPPDLLLTETVGRQVGVPAHAHFSIGGTDATPRREWGMRLVHEIGNRLDPWNDSLDRFILAFGYGKPEVEVFNYWSENPPVYISNEQVKWLAMRRTSEPRAMLVLQSYSPEPTTAKVSFANCRAWMDAETGEPVNSTDGAAEITFTEPYGTKMLVAAPTKEDAAEWRVPENPQK